ncbi:hypothetical protein BHE74_00025345 [Ensete ventricosum]|nr:hypothetical protein BHE74_00025345 [Ensete ventricosum]
MFARLPVHGPLATGRFNQKSIVGGRLKGEIDRRRSIEREKGRKKKKRKKKKKKEKRRKRIPIACARSSPVRCRRSCVVASRASSPPTGRQRPRAVAARGSRALFLPRGEKDRGDVASARPVSNVSSPIAATPELTDRTLPVVSMSSLILAHALIVCAMSVIHCYKIQGLQFRPVPPVSGGTYRSVRLSVCRPFTGRFRQKSTIGGRFRGQSIKGEKGKKKKQKRRKKEKRSTYFPVPSSPARHRRTQVASARALSPPVGCGRFFSRARRRNVSPRGEEGRGDVAPFLFFY